MSPEDIKKLLGGYATGTLTEAEQQALFAAALEDQDLFDALAHEQPLHELLADPSARAELLSALDTPSNRQGSFWQWLRRPLVAGLATAGVTAIALVAVWQGTRVAPVKPEIVAELRDQPAPSQPPAEIPLLPAPKGAGKGALKMPLPARTADQAPPPTVLPPASGMPALVLRKDEVRAATASAPPPPPPAPKAMEAMIERNAKTEAESSAQGQTAGAIAGAVPDTAARDARALFYTNQPAPGANAFVQPSGIGGAVPPPPQADAAPRVAKAVAGLATNMMAPAPRLGVRVSILRGDREVDLTTVLDRGETVFLRVTPNADGELGVVEGGQLIAGGTVQRFRPFETTPLRFKGSGRDQVYVVFSRHSPIADLRSLENLARRNLVQTSADQGRATYFVSSPGDSGAEQLVVPVTLIWR
jgi:hypothetical protein